jgi:hypothetical protein
MVRLLESDHSTVMEKYRDYFTPLRHHEPSEYETMFVVLRRLGPLRFRALSRMPMLPAPPPEVMVDPDMGLLQHEQDGLATRCLIRFCSCAFILWSMTHLLIYKNWVNSPEWSRGETRLGGGVIRRGAWC